MINLDTLRKEFHSHICTLWCHRFWNELSNQIELHISLSISHISISSHHVFCRNASWSLWGLLKLLKDHGGRSWALGTRTPSSSSLLCLFSSSISMADCGLSCEAEDSGLSETLCCRSHTQTYLLQEVTLEIRLSLLHLGLIQIKPPKIDDQVHLKQIKDMQIVIYTWIPR